MTLGGCAHSDVAIHSPHEAGSRTSVTSGSVGLQVNASGGLAALLAGGVLLAAAASEPDESYRWPRFRSISEWLSGPAAPPMDPARKVSEQDCSKPIASSGNLRCR